ncbi:MAG: type II toxin-antitoxin system PemK/MazF family toxin [Oscillospiraceae bacterium]|nr:type II toxin-antitoxin system PemK/MazF family toxin [Oscillospiraceae bacterium]
MNTKLHPAVHRGDVFYADMGVNVGSEQNGMRPVLVLQNDVGNEHSPTIIVAVLTSKVKKMYMPTHVYVGARFGLTEESVVLTEQLSTIDRRRLRGYVGSVDRPTMKKVEQAIQISLGLLSERGCAE